MLLKITEKCSMGCSHCMNDAKPDGEHMSLSVLEDSLKFLVDNNAYHSIIVTGGEPTEHPAFPFFMGYIIGDLTKQKKRCVVSVTTNGFWILDNLSAAKEIAAGSEYVKVQFQVSTDSRYYPKQIDRTKRIWREPGFVFCDNCVETMYPQGRAKQNNLPYTLKVTKCFNVRAMTKQLPEPTIESVVMALMQRGKFCTPSIKIDGSIALGESDLCPKCASIYDDPKDIIQKIKDFKCYQCAPLNEGLDMKYRQFVL